MTEADFLKTILDNPDDEVGRLAYADWLMERGDSDSAARGEFIQVQIQLAHRTAGGGNPSDWVDAARVPELKAREQALLTAHKSDWAKPIAKLVDGFEFHKGFIEHVTLDGNKVLLNAEQLFDLAPIQRLRLTGALTQRLVDSPLLRKITGLDFSRTYIGDHGLRTLLASANLDRVTWLDLSRCYITDRGAQALAESPLLAQLQHLNLGHNSLGLNAVRSIFGSPHWGKVKTLILTGNPYIDSRAQQFLARTLQGDADPALLRSMLQLSSREEREYSNVHVRELAQRAGSDPAAAPAVLSAALGDAHRKVRSAAAQMLAQLGGAGVAGLPKMVQRLFEQNPLVRDQVAPALARLLPELPVELQRWLCRLANPLLPAHANLQAVLAPTSLFDNQRLPDAVREGFAAVCARRATWWLHLMNKGKGPAPTAEPDSSLTDVESIKQVASILLARAGQHAGRHVSGPARQKEAESAREREAAWLLARLTELFQAALAPGGAPAVKG